MKAYHLIKNKKLIKIADRSFKKIFLLVKFFNWIPCNKGLKAKILRFFAFFFLFNPWSWNVLEAERLLPSWRHISWRNTKTYIHRLVLFPMPGNNTFKTSDFADLRLSFWSVPRSLLWCFYGRKYWETWNKWFCVLYPKSFFFSRFLTVERSKSK